MTNLAKIPDEFVRFKISRMRDRFPDTSSRWYTAPKLLPDSSEEPGLFDPMHGPLVAQWADDLLVGGGTGFEGLRYMCALQSTIEQSQAQLVASFRLGSPDEVLDSDGTFPGDIVIDTGIVAGDALLYRYRSTPPGELHEDEYGNFMDFQAGIPVTDHVHVEVDQSGAVTALSHETLSEPIPLPGYTGRVLLDRNPDDFFYTRQTRHLPVVFGDEAVSAILDRLGISPDLASIA
jgi:hypothetical protein